MSLPAVPVMLQSGNEYVQQPEAPQIQYRTGTPDPPIQKKPFQADRGGEVQHPATSPESAPRSGFAPLQAKGITTPAADGTQPIRRFQPHTTNTIAPTGPAYAPPARATITANGDEQGIVQRVAEWKDGNHRDASMDAFVTALNTLVQTAALAALTPNSLPGGDGYTTLWQDTANILIGLRDEPDEVDRDDPATRAAQSFRNARYGYAVEAYVNGSVATLASHLPASHTMALQAGRGMTRPDIVVKDGSNTDVGWFDITSSNCLGHIDTKTGSGWRTKPYVAEITYPPLDITALSTTGLNSIGKTVAIRNAYRRRQRQWTAYVNGKKILFLFQIRHYVNNKVHSKAALKGFTKQALKDVFFTDFTDLPAKNLLRSFGLNVKNFGFASGGSKADGDAYLAGLMEDAP